MKSFAIFEVKSTIEKSDIRNTINWKEI